MFFSVREKEIMEPFLTMTEQDERGIYRLFFYNGDIIEATVDTCYDTDNCLEEDDINYEEYFACAIRIRKIIANKSKTLQEGMLFEINYHNCPFKYYKINTL